VTPDRLDPRALNRATLARQLLLDRAALTAGEAVRHLVGLQAQAPLAPYVGLWTRLAAFRHQDLRDLITERALVRAHLMRNTVHLVDAADFVRFRPLYQPLMDRALAGHFGRNLEPFIPLSPACRDAIAAEGERLLGFATPATAVRDVRFAPVRSAEYQTQGRSGAGRDLR
jgi:Winged helix DNA-binding domain